MGSPWWLDGLVMATVIVTWDVIRAIVITKYTINKVRHCPHCDHCKKGTTIEPNSCDD